MARPIVLLTFANQPKNSFLDLSNEDDAIFKLFDRFGNGDELKIIRDQYTSTGELIDHFQTNPDQISVFHFGGHAGSDTLHLSDQAARKQGLTALMGKQKNLRIAFLNGCNTRELVDELLARNVPVVIATTREVENKPAIELAVRFYTKLTAGSTIKVAFEEARDAIKTISDVDVNFRNSGPESGPEIKEDAFAWGLYYKDAKALEWRLNQAIADVHNVSRNFWFRFIFLLLILFGLFSWANRHFGTASTASFLSIGPLAIVGILFFLKNTFQNISPVISESSNSLSAFFLKTPVLLSVGIIAFGIALIGSSIVVQHDDLEKIGLSVTDQEGDSVQQWQLETGGDKRSRLFLLTNPFSRSLKLNVDGYQPTDIWLSPFIGNRLSVDSLQAKAALLIRLPVPDFQLAQRINIRIDKLPGDPIIVNSISKASLLVGSTKGIPESNRTNWLNEISAKSSITNDQAKKIINRWSDPRIVHENQSFTPGDQIKISKIINDSTYFVKDFMIANQKINDVLLEN